MKTVILAALSGVALFGIAACSDSSDTGTTQSTTPSQTDTMTPSETAPQAAPDAGTVQPTQPAPAQ